MRQLGLGGADVGQDRVGLQPRVEVRPEEIAKLGARLPGDEVQPEPGRSDVVCLLGDEVPALVKPRGRAREGKRDQEPKQREDGALDSADAGPRVFRVPAEPAETEATFAGNALIKAHAAVQATGLKLGTDIGLALDVASSEFFDNGVYSWEGGTKSSDEMTAIYEQWVRDFPIVSIEDPLAEDDWAGWSSLLSKIGDKIQVVGDDLFVTNVTRLQRGIDERAASALLVKVNQIGSLTETLDAVSMAQRAGFACMMSHRSGETEDTTIADLAVAVGSGQIKTGAPARSDRVAKYNQLLRIEEQLGDAARYAGAGAFPRYRSA